MSSYSRRRRRDPDKTPAARVVGMLFRPGRLGTAALVVSLVGFTPVVMRSMADGRRVDAFRIGPDMVRLVAAEPVDSPEKLVARVVARVGELFRTDEDLGPRLVASFKEEPAVSWVHKVSLRPDGTVDVKAHFRRAIAVVIAADGMAYAAAGDATVLPIGDVPPERLATLPVVRGLDVGPPADGRRWEGRPAVADALRLADRLASVWPGSGLRVIDVDESSAGPRFGLVGDDRTVLWGSAVDREAAGEPNVDAKLRELVALEARPGRYDLSGGGTRLSRAGRSARALR